MASPPLLLPEKYLTNYYEKPVPEYAHGQLVPRWPANCAHADAQAILVGSLSGLRQTHCLFTAITVRVQTTPDTYRLPDIVAYADEKPHPTAVPTTPPLLIIEIISPDDRASVLFEKCAEYERWGVPHIWLIEPQRQTLAYYRSGALQTTDSLSLTGYPFTITAADLFNRD